MEKLTMILIGLVAIAAIIITIFALKFRRDRAARQGVPGSLPPLPGMVPGPVPTAAVAQNWLLVADLGGVEQYVQKSAIQALRIVPNKDRSRFRLQLVVGDSSYYTSPVQTESEALQQLKTLMGIKP